MKGRRSRSRGIRHPVRNAVLYGLLAVAGIALVVLGVLGMRATGKSGSLLLFPGLLLALPGLIACIHYLRMISVFRGLRIGRDVIARWTLPAGEFQRFCAGEQDIPARSVTVNFYRLPPSIPADGIEVVFSDAGVLVEGGYFPLSTVGGRRVQGVRLEAGEPASIEFTMVLETRVRTSSGTMELRREASILRVPVASGAMQQAGEVVRRYRALVG